MHSGQPFGRPSANHPARERDLKQVSLALVWPIHGCTPALKYHSYARRFERVELNAPGTRQGGWFDRCRRSCWNRFLIAVSVPDRRGSIRKIDPITGRLLATIPPPGAGTIDMMFLLWADADPQQNILLCAAEGSSAQPKEAAKS
jgi:hypothetical protein